MAQFGDNTYALEILYSMEKICLSNFRRLSIVRPKYLALLLMKIDELFNERSIVGWGGWGSIVLRNRPYVRD